MSAKTVGEACRARGFSVLMLQIAALAEALQRIPVGEWDYRFVSDPMWRVCLNGGTAATWTPPDAPAIPRFHAYVEYHGWPAAMLNAAGGSCMVDEDTILAAVATEIACGQ